MKEKIKDLIGYIFYEVGYKLWAIGYKIKHREIDY